MTMFFKTAKALLYLLLKYKQQSQLGLLNLSNTKQHVLTKHLLTSTHTTEAALNIAFNFNLVSSEI